MCDTVPGAEVPLLNVGVVPSPQFQVTLLYGLVLELPVGLKLIEAPGVPVVAEAENCAVTVPLAGCILQSRSLLLHRLWR